MCVLEGFRFLKMCLYIKDRFFLESCAPPPKQGKSALGTRLLKTLPRLRKQVLWRHGPRNVTWYFGWIFQDYFSEICLITSLWNPLLGSFCVIKKDLCIPCRGSNGGLPAISLAFGRANVGGSTAGFVRNSGYSPLVDVDRSFARFTSSTL